MITGRSVDCDFSMSKFKFISWTELKNIIIHVNKNKSSVDGITSEIMQTAFAVIGDRFLQMINTSLEYGRFPKKSGKIQLLFQ